MKNLKKGFTLIELLVVIAIIGILASVVLASLNTARGKGADAAIKANLSGIRAQAELYYDSNSSTYGAAGNCSVTNTGTVTAVSGACAGNIAADTSLINAVKAATSASGATGYVNIAANGAAWASWVPLKTTTTYAQCVDSTGASKTLTSLPGASVTVCP